MQALTAAWRHCRPRGCALLQRPRTYATRPDALLNLLSSLKKPGQRGPARPTPHRARSAARPAIDAFAASSDARRALALIGVRGTAAARALEAFVASAKEDTVAGRPLADVAGRGSETDRRLLARLYDVAAPTLNPAQRERLELLRATADLREPHEWRLSSRRRQPRNVHLHIGPTNSGKTHAALAALVEARTAGLYLAPLRLLAHEVYERFNSRGIACDLLTGDLQKQASPDEPARLCAATVEMAPLAREWDVAVIDEYQLLGDASRGWAWTNALLGIRARELHLCGDASAVSLVEKICAGLGDRVHVHHHERLNALSVAKKPLGSVAAVERGDCIVAFSRRSIFQLKAQIEQQSQLRCAVIYGSLPPETRAEQARLFNGARSADVLIASDAVGLGLNLNIQRIVFSSSEKFDGAQQLPLTAAQVKQIGGRAGRFGTATAAGGRAGIVATLHARDLPHVRACMAAESVPDVPRAGLMPTLDQLESLSDLLPRAPLVALLEHFERMALVDGHYFLCRMDEQKAIARLIEPFDLELAQRHVLLHLPLPPGPYGEQLLGEFAQSIADGAMLDAPALFPLPRVAPRSAELLAVWEALHGGILAYLWLTYRFPDVFVDRDSALELKLLVELVLQDGLEHLLRASPSGRVARRSGSIGNPKHAIELQLVRGRDTVDYGSVLAQLRRGGSGNSGSSHELLVTALRRLGWLSRRPGGV